MDKFKKQSLIILGKKVRLRLIQEKDLENLRRWRNENRAYFFNSAYISKESQQKWFKSYQQKENDLIFIIETLAGKPVGTVSLYKIDPETRQAEFGRIMIGDLENRRKGFAQDASKTLIHWGFAVLGLQKIVLELLESNEPAIRLYKKIGFKKISAGGDRLKFSLDKL